MTIHHDKLAYGKLVSMREDVSEEDLIAMLSVIAEDTEIASDKKEQELSEEDE